MTERTAPAGYPTLSPWVVTDDTAGLIDFLTRAYDGVELSRVATEDGRIGHAEVGIGDAVVLAFDRAADWPPMPALLRLYVQDVDASVSAAVSAGALVVTAPADAAWGDRTARVRDPFGNLWWLMAHVEDVDEEEMWRRLGTETYAAPMRDAQETLDAELSGRSGRASAPVRH